MNNLTAPRIGQYIEIRSVPTTTLYGSYDVIDLRNGLQIWRGHYLDAVTGRATAGDVPAHVWDEYVQMTGAINAEMQAREDAARDARIKAALCNG